MKKKLLAILFAGICNLNVVAQNDSIFTRRIYNVENEIYIEMNFKEQNITIPGQDYLGEIAGFIGDEKDFRKWLIIEADTNGNNALLQIINLEGSEDLEAKLTLQKDGTYILRQESGSTLKIARNRKWKKLPKELVFTTSK